MRIKRFEDIEAWKEARKLTRMTYALTTHDALKRDWGLATQLQRADVSVMSNIAEGFDSGSKPEFMNFLRYARRSSLEVQCHLYAAADQQYISHEEFTRVYSQAEKSRMLVVAFIRYLRGSSVLKAPVGPTDEVTNRPTRTPANRPTGKPADRSIGQLANPRTCEPANRQPS